MLLQQRAHEVALAGIKVTTTTIHAKEKRVGANPSGMTATRKKAVVKLSADSKNIEIFEGMV